MKITVKNKLGQQEALLRLKNFAQKLLEDYSSEIEDASQTWIDNVGEFMLKAKGFKVTGNIKVFDDMVEVNGDLPFLLRPFKKDIEKLIVSELDKLLS